MDGAERQRLIAESEKSLGFNIIVRKAMDAQIKQFKQLEPLLGRKKLMDTIDVQNLSQQQKDYIYLRMGWL